MNAPIAKCPVRAALVFCMFKPHLDLLIRVHLSEMPAVLAALLESCTTVDSTSLIFTRVSLDSIPPYIARNRKHSVSAVPPRRPAGSRWLDRHAII